MKYKSLLDEQLKRIKLRDEKRQIVMCMDKSILEEKFKDYLIENSLERNIGNFMYFIDFETEKLLKEENNQ